MLDFRLPPEKESEKHVCVEDFCGSCGPYYPVQFWADWYPERKVVEFGGLWNHIPDYHTGNTCPTESEVRAHVIACDPRDTETMFRERRDEYEKANADKGVTQD